VHPTACDAFRSSLQLGIAVGGPSSGARPTTLRALKLLRALEVEGPPAAAGAGDAASARSQAPQTPKAADGAPPGRGATLAEVLQGVEAALGASERCAS
jgi:hypothetical protein